MGPRVAGVIWPVERLGWLFPRTGKSKDGQTVSARTVRYSGMVIRDEKLWVARRGLGVLIDLEELKKWRCYKYRRH